MNTQSQSRFPMKPSTGVQRPVRPRLLAALLPAAALMLAGCSAETPEPFLLHVIASDGQAMGEERVVLEAVDAVELVFEPTGNQQFASAEENIFAEGQVRSRITAAGNYLMVLDRSWIVDHAIPNGATFQVDVPLFTDGDKPDPEVDGPALRVNFLQTRNDPPRIAQGRLGGRLPWPLPEAGEASVTVSCREETLDACRNQQSSSGN
jgi:hypothetical protein